MKLAYIDTSWLVAIALEEPGFEVLSNRLRRFDRLFSASLLEAEFHSALERESLRGGEALLAWVNWVHPNRRLTDEIARVLSFGYVRGADLWHLACALFLDAQAKELTFLTQDVRQGEVASKLGFRD